MKGLLVVLVLVLVGIAGLGFYRGWFHLSTENVDHKANVTFTVDEDKVREDGQKVRDLGPTGKEQTGDRTDKANDPGRQP
jgi:hypothetical protein